MIKFLLKVERNSIDAIMKIIVCIKQVPDTTEIKIDPKTNRIIREGVESIINPFDTYALEEALRLKEKYGGETIVISMGPPQAEVALREAISLGLDKAILLSDAAFAGSDTLATSYTLAKAIEKIGFEMIISGKEAMDGSTGQIGPELAETLNLPHISYVSKILEVKEQKIKVERMMEDHYEVLETALPALISVTKEINEPRLPSLRGTLRAKKEKITHWNIADLEGEKKRFGADGSATRVIKVFRPEVHKSGVILDGNVSESAEKLYQELKKQNIV